MKLLSIDTSVSRNLNLAISEDSSIISEKFIESSQDLSEEIIPAIDELLEKSALSLSSMDGFAFSIGPGSFTGLRIGLSCAKAVSFATGKPLIGVSSLDILANALDAPSQICSIIDAKRNNVYACLYYKKNGMLKAITPYLLMSVDSLLKKINKKTIFVGDALYLYRDKIIQYKKSFSAFSDAQFWYPKIDSLVKIAYERFKKRQFVNPKSIAPIYLYPRECQVRKSSR